MVVMAMLDMSLHNVMEETAVWMNKKKLPLSIYKKDEYGFFVHVPEESDWEEVKEEVPLDLQRAIEFAQSKECDWIMFDRDAELIRELAFYGSWSW